MGTHDLTRAVESGMATYPGDPPVRVESHATVEADGYRVSTIELGSHAGTHVDAPSHTEPNGRCLGDFPIEAFRFDARLVDCRGLDDRSALTVERLNAIEVTDADALVLDTGWARHWGTDRALDHPYLSQEAAAWCADRGLHVGTDALSVDPTPSERAASDEPDGVPAHHALLGADRLVIETLTNLGALPNRFELRAYPLAVDADGAPVRAVAET